MNSSPKNEPPPWVEEPASVREAEETDDLQAVEYFKQARQALTHQLRKVIVGQDAVIDQLLIALFTRNHALLVGVPGLAKTLLVRSLADALDLSFQRIQFTPDLMPGDITGTEILDETQDGRRQFRMVPGPVFASLLLADEINRTPPKTQAALLEAMQERRVTVAGTTHDLPSPFFVLATQNPIEQEGTYPLPEAQLDRFMFNVRVDYPSMDDEVRILLETTGDSPQPLAKVWTGAEILAVQHAVRKVPVAQSVAEYAVTLVQATRPGGEKAPDFIKRYVQWGAGPRASQYLALAGKAFAALDGRFNVAKEDIQRAAKLVLRHRLITNFRAEADGMTTDGIVERLLEVIR